jgi:hypothetical protein
VFSLSDEEHCVLCEVRSIYERIIAMTVCSFVSVRVKVKLYLSFTGEIQLLNFSTVRHT